VSKYQFEGLMKYRDGVWWCKSKSE